MRVTLIAPAHIVMRAAIVMTETIVPSAFVMTETIVPSAFVMAEPIVMMETVIAMKITAVAMREFLMMQPFLMAHFGPVLGFGAHHGKPSLLGKIPVQARIFFHVPVIRDSLRFRIGILRRIAVLRGIGLILSGVVAELAHGAHQCAKHIPVAAVLGRGRGGNRKQGRNGYRR